MRTPAGFPCLVITTSSDSARRRNRDRSSFPSARATGRIRLSVRLEPLRRFGLGDDREDFDVFDRDVIVDPNLPHPKPILRLTQPAQVLDPALADPGGLVPQVPLESLS